MGNAVIYRDAFKGPKNRDWERPFQFRKIWRELITKPTVREQSSIPISTVTVGGSGINTRPFPILVVNGDVNIVIGGMKNIILTEHRRIPRF